MAEPADLRASDAGREQLAARLRRAATEGRLTVDELEAGPRGGTPMVVTGTAPRRVRRAFAEPAR